jgi:hypothetical protein
VKDGALYCLNDDHISGEFYLYQILIYSFISCRDDVLSCLYMTFYEENVHYV